MRTALAVQDIARAGLTPAYAAANVDGHSLRNNGNEFVHVKNGSAAPINVTIQTPGSVDGNAIADRVVAVAAGGEKMIGPFPPRTYNQDGTDDVYLDFSDVTTVTIGAFRPQ